MNNVHRMSVTVILVALSASAVGAQRAPKPEDLRKLAESLVKATKEGRQEPFQRLAIPNSEAWFARVFGDRAGLHFGPGYAANADSLPQRLMQRFAGLSARSGLRFEAENLKALARRTRYSVALPVREASRAPQELFGLWFTAKDEPVQSLGYWCFAEGEFRFVGWMYVVWKENSASLIRVGPESTFQDVGPTRLKNRVPQYPVAARQAHVQGTVQVMASVAPDGSLTRIEVKSGHMFLVQSVLDVLPLWRFTPLLIDGQPEEVILLIEVEFTLSS